jgi:hypothetical protein
LVVGGLEAGAACKEEEKLRWGVRIVGRFRDIDLDKMRHRHVISRQRRRRPTSTSLSLMISPVEACPLAAGL